MEEGEEWRRGRSGGGGGGEMGGVEEGRWEEWRRGDGRSGGAVGEQWGRSGGGVGEEGRIRMGCNYSIMTRLKEVNAAIYVMGCQCHIIHNTAGKASNAFEEVRLQLCMCLLE